MAVIGIDFDHTLVNGDVPIEGAREAINIMREHGHKVLIHSCNNPKWIEKVLDDNDIRYDHIWLANEHDGKPICDLYIDDKGYRFFNWGAPELEKMLGLIVGFDNRKVELNEGLTS